MSSSGWGGPGTGSPGESWQNGAQQGGPPGHPPQATPPAQPGSAGAGHGAPQGPGYGAPQGPGYGAPQAPGYGAPQASGYGAPASSGHDGSQGASWGAGGSGASWSSGSPQGPGGPGGPHGAWGPGSPQGPGGPGGPGQQPQRKRPWLLIGVAMTCVLALLLVVGGGIAFLALRQGEDTPIATDTPSEDVASPEDPESSVEESTSLEETTPAEEEGSDFRVASPVDPPRGSVEELWAVLEDNPLTEGSLPELPDCELPETPVEPSVEELQAVLDAASGCLNQMWATASSDRGLPWVSPKVVVYTHPDIPSSAKCDTHFSADFPRMCNLDSTIYWPVGYGTGLDLSDPADVPGAYLWDLAYIYTNPVAWNSSVAFYYLSMRDGLESTDEDRFVEAWRRDSLQDQCWAAAMSMQVPSASEPSKALREALVDPSRWSEGEPPETIRSEIRVKWIERGFESGGDLSACNTWAADVEEVT